MSWLYNRRFKIGAGLAVAGFIVPNIVSYVAASGRDSATKAKGIRFSPDSFPAWGFPFNWDDLGSIYNLAALLLGALFFGLFFRWITGIIK